MSPQLQLGYKGKLVTFWSWKVKGQVHRENKYTFPVEAFRSSCSPSTITYIFGILFMR